MCSVVASLIPGTLNPSPTVAIFGCELIRTGIRSASCIIVLFRIGSNYFLLVRCHFRIRSATTAGQYDCFEMFKTFAGILRIEAYSYCIVSIRVNSCWFVSHRCAFLSVRCRFAPVRIAFLVRFDTMK